MDVETARTAIRTSTEHDYDSQIEDDQLDVWIGLEVDALRAELAVVAPQLYAAEDTEQVVTTADPTLDKPEDFLALVRVERKYGTEWQPVDASNEHAPDLGCLNFREEGAAFKLSPAASAAGTYRIVYVPEHTEIEPGDDDTELEIPRGCRDVVIERVAARLKTRENKDPRPHLERAQACWEQQLPMLRRRYGAHPEPGFRPVMRW